MSTRISASLLSMSLLASSLAAMGCGSSGSAPAPRTGAEVAAVTEIQSRAAEEGLDGVHGIDCSKGAKVCTAKGFDYDKVSPTMPEIDARTAASDSKPTDDATVANR